MQLLTVPCYFFGAAVYMATAWLSDRLQKRGVFCVVLGAVSTVGYAVLLSNVGAAAHYVGCFLVAAGLYVVVGLPLAWVSHLMLMIMLMMEADMDELPNNIPRYGKRTTATGLQLTIGNTAGILSGFI